MDPRWADLRALRDALLAWYRQNRRDLPWRHTRDPYAILVSEMLLQQTRVATGIDAYRRFLERFPTVQDLAATDEQDVLKAWEGLGYYGRARRLHATAREVVEKHNGRVPSDPKTLAGLPGLGPYTAAAVASLAYDASVPVVDGNVTRVLSRVARVEEDIETAVAKRRVADLARRWLPPEHAAEWNSAMMELGALVCTPRSPRCDACPLAPHCEARAAGIQEQLPRHRPAKPVPEVPVVFGLIEEDGRVLLVQREGKGLLAGLWGLPGGEHDGDETPEVALRNWARERLGVEVEVIGPAGDLRQTFSHRRWQGPVLRCRRVRGEPIQGRWCRPGEMASLPLVSFHRPFLRVEGG